MNFWDIFSTMIIEKEKILWKPRNAGIACVGSAYIGMYAHGVNILIFTLNKDGGFSCMHNVCGLL